MLSAIGRRQARSSAPRLAAASTSSSSYPAHCQSRAVGALARRDATPATPSKWSNSTVWRPVSILDEWVAKEARPISLRQLMVFGRSLTESRLISSANYVRTELPTRIAHRIRDMQQLPFVVVANPHISEVYDLYYNAFETFRKLKEIKTLEDNERFCQIISQNLRAHLTVIPKLAIGILESTGLMPRADLDKFMNTILRSRISRRVIAEQHLALTETFNAPWFSPGAKLSESEFIGEVFIKCVAKDVVERCAKAVQALARSTFGPDAPIPEVRVQGHLEASFPYILSHLEYIIGELLRNSVHAVVERQQALAARQGVTSQKGDGTPAPSPSTASINPPPVEVTICEAPQHVIIRISDQGGGIPRDDLPYLWSFSKKAPEQSKRRLANLGQVPKMAATMQELRAEVHDELGRADLKTPSYATAASDTKSLSSSPSAPDDMPSPASSLSSLSSLTSRPPNLRLGMGLPLSRVYAEYWAGNLELHSLEGYGVDAFLQISKLGNKNEQLTTRASIDAV